MSWCGKALTGLAFAVSADAPLNLRSYKLFVSQHVFLCPFSFFTSHWQCHSRTSFSKTVFLDNLEFGTYTSELGGSIGRIPCFKPYSGTFSEAVENSNDLNFAILLLCVSRFMSDASVFGVGLSNFGDLFYVAYFGSTW